MMPSTTTTQLSVQVMPAHDCVLDCIPMNATAAQNKISRVLIMVLALWLAHFAKDLMCSVESWYDRKTRDLAPCGGILATEAAGE